MVFDRHPHVRDHRVEISCELVLIGDVFELLQTVLYVVDVRM